MWYEFNEDNTEVIIKHPKRLHGPWDNPYETVPEIIWRYLDNEEYMTHFKTDENGTKYYKTQVCEKCLGSGERRYYYEGGGGAVYDCGNCKGTGKLKRAKTYKIHTHEYGKVLQQEYAKKQNDSFYEKNPINREDNTTYVYLGNTYEIKDKLKAKGAKYDSDLGWHSVKPIDEYPCIKIVAPVSKYEDGIIYLDTIAFESPDSGRLVSSPKMKEVKEIIRKANEEYLEKIIK